MANPRNLKPPWQPGQSGNPHGRPKGRSISEELKAILGEYGLNDRPRKDGKLISRQIAEKLIKKSLGLRTNASLVAIDMVMDRTEGKVGPAVDTSNAHALFDDVNDDDAGREVPPDETAVSG